MRKIEVRCCCDSNRLLGYTQVTEEQVAAKAVTINIRSAMVRSQPMRYERVTLDIARVRSVFECWLAVKSNNVPLETLRLLPGFEAVDEIRTCCTTGDARQLETVEMAHGT